MKRDLAKVWPCCHSQLTPIARPVWDLHMENQRLRDQAQKIEQHEAAEWFADIAHRAESDWMQALS